jgi:hypothetical protein
MPEMMKVAPFVGVTFCAYDSVLAFLNKDAGRKER